MERGSIGSIEEEVPSTRNPGHYRANRTKNFPCACLESMETQVNILQPFLRAVHTMQGRPDQIAFPPHGALDLSRAWYGASIQKIFGQLKWINLACTSDTVDDTGRRVIVVEIATGIQ